MNTNLIEGTIASIIASLVIAALSPWVVFILNLIGVNTQVAYIIISFLFVGVVLFLLVRALYPKWKIRVVQEVLKSTKNDDIALRNKILTQLGHNYPPNSVEQGKSVMIFENQKICEKEICEAFNNAKKVKILTIRGQEYFLSARSLFHDLFIENQKKGKDAIIQILVLSPESNHISEELARKLGHLSAEHIRIKMRLALDNLKHIGSQHKNFTVRCYDETPIFKILLFDDIVFVSSFDERGGRKNDQNAKMWQMTRHDNPVFTGFERHFDKMWERSISPE